jgi:hypothetical protein
MESLRIKHIMYLSYSFGVTRAGKAKPSQAKPCQALPCPATRDFDELQQIRQSFFTCAHMSTSEWRIPVYGEGGGRQEYGMSEHELCTWSTSSPFNAEPKYTLVVVISTSLHSLN